MAVGSLLPAPLSRLRALPGQVYWPACAENQEAPPKPDESRTSRARTIRVGVMVSGREKTFSFIHTKYIPRACAKRAFLFLLIDRK